MWTVYECQDCWKLWVSSAGSILRCSYCNSKDRELVYEIESPIGWATKMLNSTSIYQIHDEGEKWLIVHINLFILKPFIIVKDLGIIIFHGNELTGFSAKDAYNYRKKSFRRMENMLLNGIKEGERWTTIADSRTALRVEPCLDYQMNISTPWATCGKK